MCKKLADLQGEVDEFKATAEDQAQVIKDLKARVEKLENPPTEPPPGEAARLCTTLPQIIVTVHCRAPPPIISFSWRYSEQKRTTLLFQNKKRSGTPDATSII